MSGLERVPKTGAYRYRRGIPVHLRAHFPDKGTVWREHLNTKVEHEARVRCLEVAARVERLFQQAQADFDATRQEKVPETSTLSIELLTAVVADWKRQERSRRAQHVLVRPIMPGWSDFLRECTVLGICGQKPNAEEPEAFMARLESEQLHIDRFVQDITRGRGLLIGPDHPAHAILGNLVRKAWIEVLEAEHRWRTHDYSDLPIGDLGMLNEPAPSTALQVSRSADQPTAVEVGPLLSEAFEDWRRLGKPAPRTLMEAQTAMRLFKELHGDLPITQIGKPHARAFRDALAKLPKHLTAKQKTVPLPKLLAEHLSGEVRAPQTINKTLNLLSGVLSRAEKEGHFDDRLWSNPFSVHLDVGEEDEDSYEPFSEGEIQALFKSPIFTIGARPKQGRGDTAFWAPLVALFHGARRGEVLQLFVRDVRQDPESGVWFVDVNRDDGKTVKNPGSIRRFPLHPTMIKLGFLDYVEARRRTVGPPRNGRREIETGCYEVEQPKSRKPLSRWVQVPARRTECRQPLDEPVFVRRHHENEGRSVLSN